MTGAWRYALDHGQLCRVIEEGALWGERVCRVWLAESDAVVSVLASRLALAEDAGLASADRIAYAVAAARVADVRTQDMLLAPVESSVIPLPHQLQVLSRAVAGDRVRYLLADEVGLGKTVEAGLILRELKLRGLAERTLVIAPKGLVSQWAAEMRTHFNEPFQIVLPEDVRTLGRMARADAGADGGAGRANPWAALRQAIAPMDAVKPLDRRRGWSAAQLEAHNQERFGDLVSAGWDLVIVDEAHRLGGSTDQVARYRLGRGLADAAPYLLLLSATPHQGKTDAFHRLLSLLDADAFPDAGSVTRERVEPYVIRTEKRRAIDAEGAPLFKPRRTELAPVSWGPRHRDQAQLYEAVTAYVREGYNQAIQEKRSYIGFLMILMQRLMVSSTSAIRSALERRLHTLSGSGEQLPLFALPSEEEWADLDGQDQLETLLRTRLKAVKNERSEVRVLLEAATRCEQAGPDAKAEALLDWLYRLQSEEGDPELKALVFTEFIPTQEMLRRYLTDRGFAVTCLNGSMDMEERGRVQEAFARDARILISTDAGGEGLNLQFCHVVINYDIPWNPMRLEQRIGRVDRIGQNRTVRAINFVFEGSVEHRVREVLERKLAVIFEEFGIDKTGDVLDSAQAGELFDAVYVDAILNPDAVETSVEGAIAQIEEQAREVRSATSLLGASEELDAEEAQRLATHPLSRWVERMTVSYLRAYGGAAEWNGRSWRLVWPDGTTDGNVVFAAKDAERAPAARRLTLEDPRVRRLAERIPMAAPECGIPVVALEGLPAGVRGVWALWRIAISGLSATQFRMMSLFLSDDGEVYVPTARHVWDQLLASDVTVQAVLAPSEAQTVCARLLAAAEEHGKPIYDELVREHERRIAREREKACYAFAARRRVIERIGLPEVRAHRSRRLDAEERETLARFDGKARIVPELTPLLAVRVEDAGRG